MYDLHLKRFYFGEEDTVSNLFLPDDNWECFILEDQYQDEKVHGETCIPEGRYRLELKWTGMSEKYGHKMICVEDVPGFQHIRFHKGNREDDTDGCLLPGRGVIIPQLGTATLYDSKGAYDTLYRRVSRLIQIGDTHLDVTKQVVDTRYEKKHFNPQAFFSNNSFS